MQSLEEKTGGNVNPSERKAGRIEFLDFARGFAILTIVIYHYLIMVVRESSILSDAILVAAGGGHLFVIMAGFGLYLSISSFHAGAFYKRRFVRVLIPYYIVITFIFGMNLLFRFYPENGLYAYLGHIFWYKMFDESIVVSFGGQFWFLSLIIQFYLVFPLLYYAMRRLNNNVVFAILATVMSAAYWVVIASCRVGGVALAEMRIYNSALPQFLWEFCIAMVLADALKKRGYRFWEQKGVTLAILAAGGMAVWGLSAVKGGYVGRVFNAIPTLVGFTSLCALAYLVFKRLSAFDARANAGVLGYAGLAAKKAGAGILGFFVYAGGISYELFLLHVFVGAMCLRVLYGGEPRLVGYAIAFPIAIAVAHLYRMFCAKLFAPAVARPGAAAAAPRG